tara:strand:+ start:228 stop:356 length:129 start_codon:yes stop_codon:yes gene_type:complete
LCGTEDAGKSEAEGLSFPAAEPVRKGRVEEEGFLASAGAWDL